MNPIDNSYCRLCAELKPKSKLLDLQIDDIKRCEIFDKLSKINAATNFNEEVYPKTVCLVCVGNLEQAFDFVVGVEQAQIVLSNVILFQQIKKESHDTAFSDDDFDNCDGEETKYIKQEVDCEALPPLPKVKKKTKQIGKTKATLDTIPLAQLKLTWKDYCWTCSYCATQFTTIGELTAHSIKYHDTCSAFRCTDCNKRKLKLDPFITHVKRHRKYLKLSCYKCLEAFNTPTAAINHKKVHVTSEFVCTGCNTYFTSLEELDRHTNLYQQRQYQGKIIPSSLADNLTCKLCKKTFKHKGSLNTHLLIHTDRKRDHTCEICGKTFLHKQNLIGHMILHDSSRPYQCEICKASFKTQVHLRHHVGVHDNKKPFACDQCGRCFRLQKQLTSHSIIHTDSHPHICSYCNKSFRFKTILNQHLRQHTGVKPYSCAICQRDFTNWPNYNKHMKRRHGMDMAKKKHTPDGVFPINPATGEVIIIPETNTMIEWKKQMMSHRRPGRPKVKNENATESSLPAEVENIA